MAMSGDIAYALSKKYVAETMAGAGAIKGDKGDTPQRGIDYWTNTDKEEILSECKSYIDSEILGGES